MSVFRIAFGVLSLLNTLLFLPDFLVWFGQDGAASLSSVARLQSGVFLDLLLRWRPGDGFYLLLLGLELVASALTIVGFWTRSSLAVVCLTRLILYQRNPLFWHQVDILLRYYGPMLLLTPASGEMYSVDAWLRRRANPEAPVRHFSPWPQRLIQVKLALIYLEAFLGKMAGKAWWDGSAVYYATHFTEGSRVSLPGFLDALWVYQALTYFTLAIEFCLFSLIWFPRWRYRVLLGGVLFHLGIHLFIALDLLEFGVLAAYLCFVYPGDMERWVNRLLPDGRPAQVQNLVPDDVVE